MGKINLLDIQTANLIAAGEVVERPASAVKELCENSIDADATMITVEIRGGGNSYLRVSDNGSGISDDDMPKTILRHATSKIKTGSDLDGVVTLGFRGEALASIASVSAMTVTSRTAEQSCAYSIHEGEVGVAAGGLGTKVDVESSGGLGRRQGTLLGGWRRRVP